MPECRTVRHLVIPVPEWKKCQCRNQPGNGVRKLRLILECSSTGLSCWMPECRCSWHRPRCRCPAMDHKMYFLSTIVSSQLVLRDSSENKYFFLSLKHWCGLLIGRISLFVDNFMFSFACGTSEFSSNGAKLSCNVYRAIFLYWGLCFCFSTHQISEDTRCECYLNYWKTLSICSPMSCCCSSSYRVELMGAEKDLHQTISQTQCCGSKIWCLFDPWIRDPGWVKSKDPDPGWTTWIIFPRA